MGRTDKKHGTLSLQSTNGEIKSKRGKRDCGYLFKYLILCNICLYLETGAVPALLVTLSRQFSMGKQTQGLLGGVVYLALSIGGPLAGICLTQYSSKTVLCISLALCNTFCLCLACSPTTIPHAESLFIASRAFLGICQCFFCIFVPIWTDDNAPAHNRASWMGYMQASTPVSVMCGYLIASVSLWIDRRYEWSQHIFAAWRWPFFIQFLLMLFFCVGIFFVPEEHLNLGKLEGESKEDGSTQQQTFLEMVRTRFVNRSWTPVQAPLNPKQEKPKPKRTLARRGSPLLNSPTLNKDMTLVEPKDPARRRNLSNYTIQTSFVLPFRAKDSLIQSFNFDDAEVLEHMKKIERNSHNKFNLEKIEEHSYQNSEGSLDAYADALKKSGSLDDLLAKETPRKPPASPLSHSDMKYYMARVIESQRMLSKEKEEEEEGRELRARSMTNQYQAEPANDSSKRSASAGDLSDLTDTAFCGTASSQGNRPTTPTSPRSNSQNNLLVQYTRGKLHFKRIQVVPQKSPTNQEPSAPQPRISKRTLVLSEADVSDLSSTLKSFGDVTEKDASICEQLRSLFSNSVYVSMVMAISASYFVVTGIQFWGTAYMLLGLGGSEYIVNILFMITAASAPTLGVFFGGAMVDRIGGYKGIRQQVRALRVVLVCGCITLIFAVPTTYFHNLYIVVVMLWITLFFGASSLPSITGIIISVVGRHQRELASSTALVLFNLLGYSLCPILSGTIMQYLGDHYPECDSGCQTKLGMRFVLFWTTFAVLSILSALILSTIKKRQQYLPVWNQDFEVVSPLPSALLNQEK